MPRHTTSPPAWILLPGHPDATAQVSVECYPFWARAARTALLSLLWGGTTVAAFFVTMFDPFLSGIPLIMGTASVWRSWRGQFRVRAFQGRCPRCATALRLDAGARIRSPHRLVCYHCHHEPHLALAH